MEHVKCLVNLGEIFTKDRLYKVSSKGVIDDDGYRYTNFLNILKDESPAKKWVIWTADIKAGCSATFEIYANSVRRF